MSKLAKYQKVSRKFMMQEFKASGGMLFADESLGVTVAVMPVDNTMRKPKFAVVATAYCSLNDKWNRKMGEYLVLMRMNCGNTITVPAPGYCNYQAIIAEQVMETYATLANFC